MKFKFLTNSYLTFEDIHFTINRSFYDTRFGKLFFKNGYGVSVVSGPYSYGGNDGLYELAVLEKGGSITYDTPITSDVVGFLSERDVSDIMKKIQKL